MLFDMGRVEEAAIVQERAVVPEIDLLTCYSKGVTWIMCFFVLLGPRLLVEHNAEGLVDIQAVLDHCLLRLVVQKPKLAGFPREHGCEA